MPLTPPQSNTPESVVVRVPIPTPAGNPPAAGQSGAPSAAPQTPASVQPAPQQARPSLRSFVLPV